MKSFLPILFFIAIVFVNPSIVSAEGTIELELAERTAKFYDWSIGIGVIMALGVLVYAGFLYATSAGSSSRIKDAKKWIVAGLSGLLILFSSFLLLSTINPDLTNLESIILNVADKGKFIPPKLTLPDPSIVSTLPPSNFTGGTYSCDWDENATLGGKCKPAIPNECRGGFVPGNNCTAGNSEEARCEAIQEATCKWEGGTSYDIFAAVARSYVIGPQEIPGDHYPDNLAHQNYVNAPPTIEKTEHKCYGAQCGVYVATIVQQTIDSSFPDYGTSAQGPYMQRNPQIYERVGGPTGIVTYQDQLRPGDILIDAGFTEHIALVLDDGIYEAKWRGGYTNACLTGSLPAGPHRWSPGLLNVAFRYRGFKKDIVL